MALRAIVSDPSHGSDSLSSPQIMSNLLQDLLPDAPREVGLMVAAASAGLPAALREHVAHGLGVELAIGLAASSLAARTAFAPAACAWVATELAIALDLASPDTAVMAPSEDLGTGDIEDITGPDARPADVPATQVAVPAGPPDLVLAQTPVQPAAMGPPILAEPVPPTAPIGAPTRPGPPGRRMGPAALVGVSIVVAGAVVAGAIVLASRSGTGPARHGRSGTPSATGSGSPTKGTTTASASPPGYHVTATLNPGTQGSITQVAWRPNSKVVATSDKDGRIYLWDPATGRLRGRPLTAGAGRAFCAAISPDGSTLAAGYSDGSTYLWNIATGQQTAALPDPGPPSPRKQVDSVAFSPDGHMLVSADGNGNAYVWRISQAHQSSTPVKTLPDPASSGVWSVTFSGNGTLATGDYAGYIYLWNVRSGSHTGPIVIPGAIPVTALAFSPVGNVLAAGSGSFAGSGSMYLFSTTSQASRFIANAGPVWAMSFAGKTLAAADGNGRTYLWNVNAASLTATAAGTLTDPNSGSQGVGALGFSPDGKWLVTGDTNGRAYVWMSG